MKENSEIPQEITKEKQNILKNLKVRSISEQKMKQYEVNEEDIIVEFSENIMAKESPQSTKNTKIDTELKANNTISLFDFPIKEVVEEEETSKHETSSKSLHIQQNDHNNLNISEENLKLDNNLSAKNEQSNYYKFKFCRR